MAWVRRTPPDPPHTCKPPGSVHNYGGHPAGSRGDLWRCDTCGTLWRIGYDRDITGLTWLHATVWQRIRYRRKP
jgi:hypothetical protein